MWPVIIFSVLLCVIFLHIMKQYKDWKSRGIKQKIQYIPFADNFKQMLKLKSSLDLLTDLYSSFPNERYIGYYQFNKPSLMIKDPELIKQICIKDFDHFSNHIAIFPEDSDYLILKSIFFLRGQEWKDMRSILSPAFTGSKMRQMFELMHECARNFAEYFNDNPKEIIEVELKECFSRYANDIIATTAFGINCDSLKEPDNEFYTRGIKATDPTGFWKNIKLLVSIIAPKFGKLIGVSFFDETVTHIFREIIEETVEFRKKNNVKRPDMIDLLMNARKNGKDHEETSKRHNFPESNPNNVQKNNITIDDISAQAFLFFFAGFETVSVAMSFMAYELALNPDIQQKLIKELDEFREKNEKITYETLSKLPYFDMVFSETLRKWPPNIVTDRQCVKPYLIKAENPYETSIELTTADRIFIPIGALHHDEKYWKNPGKFDPERFSPENKDKIEPCTYLPFGVGPRNCIASRFATIEVKAVICGLLQYFEIVPIEKSTIPLKLSKTSLGLASENGFWLGLKKRKISNKFI